MRPQPLCTRIVSAELFVQLTFDCPSIPLSLNFRQRLALLSPCRREEGFLVYRSTDFLDDFDCRCVTPDQVRYAISLNTMYRLPARALFRLGGFARPFRVRAHSRNVFISPPSRMRYVWGFSWAGRGIICPDFERRTIDQINEGYESGKCYLPWPRLLLCLFGGVRRQPSSRIYLRGVVLLTNQQMEGLKSLGWKVLPPRSCAPHEHNMARNGVLFECSQPLSDHPCADKHDAHSAFGISICGVV